MNYFSILGLFIVVFSAFFFSSKATDDVPFNKFYFPLWGENHISVTNGGCLMEMSIDQYSGAGFCSKLVYGSGFFRMRIKLPNKASSGLITTVYLTSKPINKDGSVDHDELDLEFLGSNGMPYTLSTNIITNEIRHREQSFHLWFDPTADFHTYQIFWNQKQTVFFVDDTPIRVYKNIGVNYLSNPMHVEGSLWNWTQWVGPVDWSQGPFTAYFQGFDVDACANTPSNPRACHESSAYYWNAPEYSQLSPDQMSKYLNARKNYMTSDYCSSFGAAYPECTQ